MTPHNGSKLRSQAWPDNSESLDITALYLERFLNYGLTREELQPGRGIVRTGSNLVPCYRHHLVLFVVTGGEREGAHKARVHPRS